MAELICFTLNLPKTYTVTAKYATITKTINVTITDWGTPDRELYNRWYSDLLANSGANAINASNVVDWYRQNDPGNNGVDWYGNKYQWSVELAKASIVCNYISNHYIYVDESNANQITYTINEYYAQKHGMSVGGMCGPSNTEFARFCNEALGLNAQAIAAPSGIAHTVTRITYNGQTYDMDATPQANVQNGNGSTLNASAAPKTLGAAAPEALDAPEADEVIEDITDLVLAAEEVPEAVDEANILEAPDVSEEEYTDDVLEASEEEYTDDVLEAPEDFLSDGDFYEEDDFELMEEGF